jgi:hypothetical protein
MEGGQSYYVPYMSLPTNREPEDENTTPSVLQLVERISFADFEDK